MTAQKFKVTYITGAGASAKALPTVRATATTPGYTNALRQLADKLKGQPIIAGYVDIRDELVTDLYWLADQGDRHGTPDTFAKYCHLRQDLFGLTRIKNTLSAYFTIEQFLENKKDPRYLQFIIKLLESSKLFPDNIKILNWNYDFQFQLAAEEFQREEFVYQSTVTRHSPPLIEYYPSLGQEFHVNFEREKCNYSLIHLNGLAGFYYYGLTAHILNYFLNGSLKALDQLYEKMRTDKQYKAPLLSFAFETPNNMNNAIRNRLLYATKAVEDTDYLVIIGYSFPHDNIQTDELIMNVIKRGPLKEIFFQDPFNDGSFLRSSFSIPESIPINHITYADEFYIPRQIKMRKPESRRQ